MTSDQLAKRARGRRGRRRDDSKVQAPAIIQRPFTQLTRFYPATELISTDQVEHIHEASLKLLAETGLDVLCEGARNVMKMAGADVKDGEVRVRFDPDLIRESIANAPSKFTLHARNKEHNVIMGGNNLALAMMASAPNCSDADRGRRTGNQEDYRNFLRLAQMVAVAKTALKTAQRLAAPMDVVATTVLMSVAD